MKTPEEIKKGLEIAVNGCLTCDCCITGCPYDMECHPMNEDTNVDMPKKMVSDAIAYIQQLEAAQPRWINVKDGLPKKSGKYIVCTVKGSVYCTSAVISGDEACFKCDINTHITHWMPLPKPPKEGE